MHRRGGRRRRKDNPQTFLLTPLCVCVLRLNPVQIGDFAVQVRLSNVGLAFIHFLSCNKKKKKMKQGRKLVSSLSTDFRLRQSDPGPLGTNA